MARTGAGQPASVDQSDRVVPINLRQSGRTPVELLISTRVRKSPYWHLSHEAGCWRATTYNRVYHPRGYVRPEDGGAAVEHEALTRRVTMWNVAVERQIRVQGADAEAFVDYVITRDATRIDPMRARYVILCNERGGILNDPVLLRLSGDEFWFSLADSDLMFWLQGVSVGLGMRVEIDEVDVCPLQIQGPRSLDLMVDLVGDAVRDIPYYGLLEAEIGGCSVVVSQTGFSGEKGYEIYLRDATLHAEKLWSAVLEAGKAHELMVTAPGHQRRIQAGILSWGQDIDHETSPFQCNLAYQVPREKPGDYIGRAALERQRAEIEAGRTPFALVMVGMKLGGRPIDDYAPDFWHVSRADGGDPVGYLTSPWYAPELGSNIALGYVPPAEAAIGTELAVWLPDEYASERGKPDSARVCEVPFRPSANPSTREVALAQGRDAAR
ncbi:glycine cleavage T C-terminal barrel domain-containing protein [Candidatus Palauibacter polyketidifaciens]|uniref:glycine cleavage T C-terminal barrel domain-containing protein n=1 Tax=Candidatus Palauibacter polyketidifaciens TaxID=3056740 RepID=UPI00139D2FAA|nr:glycine cleavage T C-terminal barrel domain-containing protein [Candidatus Palauibacter polyketidifaciens]MDE2721709.1 aminomethyl transferase family protein [Candidatus Palauibacter polyketidifaciens]MYE35244.1 aminomethyl transferase family protein [Gemmatimonadales bacterium]